MPEMLWLELMNGETGALEIDAEQKTARMNGQPCHLTPQEFLLLARLIEEKNKIVSRTELLQSAWGYANPGDTRTVDVHIQRLRKKLGVSCIETVFRAGYRLQCREE